MALRKTGGREKKSLHPGVSITSPQHHPGTRKCWFNLYSAAIPGRHFTFYCERNPRPVQPDALRIAHRNEVLWLCRCPLQQSSPRIVQLFGMLPLRGSHQGMSRNTRRMAEFIRCTLAMRLSTTFVLPCVVHVRPPPLPLPHTCQLSYFVSLVFMFRSSLIFVKQIYLGRSRV